MSMSLRRIAQLAGYTRPTKAAFTPVQHVARQHVARQHVARQHVALV